jgi:molybdopterin synthase sulfur carrier subunit
VTRVRILYFAATRDAAGCSEEERELPPSVTTVADLAAFLAHLHPALGERAGIIRIARNEQFAEPSETLEHGDVIALIPPVAGG